MDMKEFRKRTMQMVEYVRRYHETLNKRRVTPDVEPGFLSELISNEVPEEPDSFDDIMKDFDTKIMPGIAHWQHPQFHAYFPTGTTYECLLSEMLTTAMNPLSFSWVSSPSCTELESIVVDWMGKALGLPDSFLFSSKGSKGGGVIQSSASECILVTMLAARARAIAHLKTQHPFEDEGLLLTKLMAYCSKQAHSCVEKAAKIAFVKIRVLETGDDGEIDPKKLIKLMEDDEYQGFVPFFVSTTAGTTGTTAIDPFEEIGLALESFPNVWLHVDGAYGGSALICPELRPLFKGIEYADSFNVNPHKWLLTPVECSIMFVRHSDAIASALVVDPLYLKHDHADAVEYRHWGIALTRRFRALKLWFLIRSQGISGLQKHIRNHVNLAKYFEGLVRQDERFEVVNDVNMGLVCFRMKGSETLNEGFLREINMSGRLHMVPGKINDKYYIRFSVNSQRITKADIDKSWSIILEYATKMWKKKKQLFDLFGLMDKPKVDEAVSYFAQKASTHEESESTIFDPFQGKEDDSEETNKGSKARRDSWISFPLGLPSNAAHGPNV